MIVTKATDLGFANLCVAAATAGHVERFKNSGDGAQTQLTYVITGQGIARPEDGSPDVLLAAGAISDMEPLMGKPFVGYTGDAALAWVSINPKLASKRYDPQLIRGGESVTVTGTDAECILVSLVSECAANGKAIGEHKFARIPSGQSVDVQVPQNSVAVFLISRLGKTDE